MKKAIRTISEKVKTFLMLILGIVIIGVESWAAKN